MPDLTNWGEQMALIGDGVSDGSIARKAVALRIYTAASVPNKAAVEGVDIIQLANGNGYTTGGVAINPSNWTYSIVNGRGQITLAGFTWTATGGPLSNIGGAYIVDAANKILAWWDRPTISVLAGDPLKATGLAINL